MNSPSSVANCMASSIRGNGLIQIGTALAKLQNDPHRLARARRIFVPREDSPPPVYNSDRSSKSTRSRTTATHTPTPPSEGEQLRRNEHRKQKKERRRLRAEAIKAAGPTEHQLRKQRRAQLEKDFDASLPNEQFADQVIEERTKLWDADLNWDRERIRWGNRFKFYKEASEIVKNCWVEQGIWNEKWTNHPEGPWKHELPLIEESETDYERLRLFSFDKPKPEKTDEKRQMAEQQEIDRQASRPYQQFFFQVSRQRERIVDEIEISESNLNGTSDVNSRAYEYVKDVWIKRGIWDPRWGIIPGMTWKHEQDFEEMLSENLGDDAPVKTQVHGNHAAGEPPVKRVLSPAEFAHHMAPTLSRSSSPSEQYFNTDIQQSQRVAPLDASHSNQWQSKAKQMKWSFVLWMSKFRQHTKERVSMMTEENYIHLSSSLTHSR